MPYVLRATVAGVGPRAASGTATTALPVEAADLPVALGALVAKALFASGVSAQDYFATGHMTVDLEAVRAADLNKSRPVIKQLPRLSGTHRQCEVSSRLGLDDVERLLGFRHEPGGGGKVRYEFTFTVDGVPCALWDYHGHMWSAWGPREALAKVFGPENVL